ncbi:MAG TPA: hypothetical protein VKB47_17965 [Terracidiphilus sp.]|nr:hypothetical protein [Terracidiphilus sp.]
MKTMLLNFEHRPSEKPLRVKVVGEISTGFLVEFQPMRGCAPEQELLTKRADGALVNVHGCTFVIVKADRRPKPYTLTYTGVDGRDVHKFATLAEVQKYVRDRWQGVEYMHSGDPAPRAFHTDYGRYHLAGCTLADLGRRRSSDPHSDEFWDWTWHELEPSAANAR